MSTLPFRSHGDASPSLLLLLSVVVVDISMFHLCINGRLQGGGQETESPRGPEHGPRSLPILGPVLIEIRKYDM